MNQPYDRAFFERQSQRSLQSAHAMLSVVLPLVQPRRVLDVGCGVAPWLRAALDAGVPDGLGIDGDYVERGDLLVDPARFIGADLATTSLRDALGPAARQGFDLAICMEVAEHLPAARAPLLVQELTALADAVLFSAALPYQFGEHHINEQWAEYWAILFRSEGFSCHDLLRARFWADPDVEWWYAQNAFLYVRQGTPLAARLPAAGGDADLLALSRVHPRNLLANVLSLPRRFRQSAAMEEFKDYETVQRAFRAGAVALPPLEAISRADAAAPGSRDVFPWTRLETYSPEAEIASLQQQVHDVGTYLKGAEQAVADARAHIARMNAARLVRDRELGAALARADALFAEIDGLRREVAEARDESAQLRQELHAVYADRDAHAARQTAAEALAAERLALVEALQASTVWRDGLRTQHMLARIPGPLRRILRLSLRLARRRPRATVVPVVETVQSLPPAEDPMPAPAPAPAAAAEPPAAAEILLPLQSWNKRIGAVRPETLDRAMWRLRHFHLFDAADYLARNEDVAEGGYDPARHFLQAGAFEDRARIDAEELARVMSGLMLTENIDKSTVAAGDDLAALPKLVAAMPHIGIYVSSHGNVFMEDIARDLAQDLQSVGVRVELLDEAADIEKRPPFCLFVAPHEFFTLGRGRQWLRDDVLANAFMFGTEQVQTKWFAQALPLILMSRGVFDICAQTAQIFRQAQMPALHLLPGCRFAPPTLTAEDRSHPLFRVLPPAAQETPEPGRGFAERPIDITFFGNSSPRRDAFFARHAGFLSEFEVFNYCRRAERGPLRGVGQEGALTRLAAHVSGHAKITLNIHRDDLGYFEWHRMVRLGMCTGSVVVSDPCLPHPDFVAGEHYFQEQTRYMPDLLQWLLRSEEGAREAERVRANVDTLISRVFDTRQTAARLLGFMAAQTDSRGAAA